MSFRTAKKGITLLELICVMTILSGVLAVSAPSLAQFFRGRALNEESRRFLALARYARSKAVSESISMELWIDASTGEYGLRRCVVFGKEEEYPLVYQLPDNLEFEFNPDDLDEKGVASFLFHPDGIMDEENPGEFELGEAGGEWIFFKKAEIGIGYVLKEAESDDE